MQNNLKIGKSQPPLYPKLNITRILLLILAVSACNPKKDKWINRNYHTLTGHYNIYFNGEQKLLDAIKQIQASHQDNFGKTLDVYKSGTPEAAKSASNLLDEAIKKFGGTISLHEVGRFTDDAYYGIGKSRFFKQDYFAAIETFQFLIGKYKNGEFTNRSTCWIARCYVGMNKIQEAEAIMGLLLTKKNIVREDFALIYATAADIDIRSDKSPVAIDHLKMALKGKLTKDEKIRYNFILGQLCMQNNRKPEARYFLNKVISYIPPYDYAFNANLLLLQIYDLSNPKELAKVKRNLKKMTRDDKNTDYLDQIYFEMGKLDLVAKNEPEAIKDFKKSISASTKNKNQKGLSYYELAKLYFNRKDFKLAQAYYDSTVQSLDQKYKSYASIKATKEVLSDLINNLVVYEIQDSLQKLSQLSKDELNRKVESWVTADKLKKEQEAKEAKKRAKIEASNSSNKGMAPSAPASLAGSGSDAWYFYNPGLVATGAAEFFSQKKWGQRANEDYWRLSAKEKPKQDQYTTASGGDTSTGKPDQGTLIPPSEKGSASQTGDAGKDGWIKNVPFTSAQKEASNAKMLEALNNLGVIYYDQLKNANECIRYYEILEDRFPASEYEPKVLYYLFRAYADLKNNQKSENNKKTLISVYPENQYALLAQNKKIVSAETENNKQLLAAYEKMYQAYHSGKYAEAMATKVDLDKSFPGNTLRAKYDLLYAFCVGKTSDREAFKKALTEVSTNFKGTEYAQTADDYLKVLNKVNRMTELAGNDSSMALPEFDLETETPFYYVFGIKNNKADFTEYASQFNTYNDAYASESNLRVNTYLSNDGYQLLVIREFPNMGKSYEYLRGVRMTDFKNKKLKLSDEFVEFVISGKNFRVVMKDKKVDSFQSFFKKQEAQIDKAK